MARNVGPSTVWLPFLWSLGTCSFAINTTSNQVSLYITTLSQTSSSLYTNPQQADLSTKHAIHFFSLFLAPPTWCIAPTDVRFHLANYAPCPSMSNRRGVPVEGSRWCEGFPWKFMLKWRGRKRFRICSLQVPGRYHF